ncbi:hypothetical protein [uncultured Campylobacter sp.]|jgi:hypothetical protein|uniref:hypothetical protein n=1 Tax=uncultured Campylobacter sp. TaxID=218934 RepID=UPI002628300F|nr:hypothetical protein [uncultured Campylobacter sp.]
MIILKIIACAFSMSFCLMCISSLMGFFIGQIFDTSSVRFDDPLEWLQQKCVYFLFLWIFFCGICAILAAKLKDFGKLTDFFVNLFLPTAAVWMLSPFLGMMIVALIVSDLHLARFYSSLLSALIFIVLFMIVVAEVLKQIYPSKS